jgi:late competence protein required for DNA uptake (superfamily II DNA/RNA helicase)
LNKSAEPEEQFTPVARLTEENIDAADKKQEVNAACPPWAYAISAEKLTCDCCGRNNHLAGELTRIDSGHLFCADCLAALRR